MRARTNAAAKNPPAAGAAAAPPAAAPGALPSTRARGDAKRAAGGAQPVRRAGGKKDEHVQVLRNDPLPSEEEAEHLRPVLEQGNDVVATALDDEEAVDTSDIKETVYCVVVKGGTFVDGQGNRATVKEGKEVDSLNFPLGVMQRSGIKLRRIEKEQRGELIPELLV